MCKLQWPWIGSKRRKHCNSCEGCRRDDCGDCSNCQDMTKFGGPGRKKKACILRRCLSAAENKQGTFTISDEHVKCSSGLYTEERNRQPINGI